MKLYSVRVFFVSLALTQEYHGEGVQQDAVLEGVDRAYARSARKQQRFIKTSQVVTTKAAQDNHTSIIQQIRNHS
jgi:hypothetical protein